MLSHKVKLLFTLVVLVGTWISPADSSATLIDFRVETFTCPGGCLTPDGETSAELVVDGVTWTVSPLPAPDARLYWDSTDGLGVRYAYENDEIEAEEILLISFSEDIYINDIHLTDLFNENGYLETGWYELSGSGVQIGFTADGDRSPSPVTNGEKVLSVNTMVSSIAFGAPGFIGQFEHHEFSVAGLDVMRPIPEPRGYVLFLAGAAICAFPIMRQPRRAHRSC